MNRRMRKQRYIWLSLFAAAAAAAILCIALLSTGQGSINTRRLLQNVKNLTRERTSATEFWYNNAEDSVFAPVGGGFVIGSRDSIRYLDSSGKETVLAAAELSSPAADFSEDLALIYDFGGKYLCLADRQGILWSGEAEGNIFSASVNASGWIAVCSEAAGYKGAVTVYNESGRAVYRWSSGSGYVTGACVSENCRELAVLTLGTDGSRIGFFRLNEEAEKARYVLPDQVILCISYAGKDTVTAVTESTVLTVCSDGTENARADLPSPYPTHFTFDGEGFTALSYKNNSVSVQGGVLTVDERGRIIAQLSTDREILSLAAAGRYVVVRYADSVSVYNSSLKVIYETEGMVDAISIMAHTDGSFIAAGEYSAEIYGK